MVMNCFPSYDNCVELRLKIIFKRAKTFEIFQRMVLAWANNLVAKGEDTPKYFPHAVRFELKIAVPLLLTEEKCKANFYLAAQIKRWGGLWSFWKPFEGGKERWRNWFSQADSPFEIQINIAYRLSNSFSKPIFLIEIAHSSWQMTLRGRCNYLNLWGPRGRQQRFCRAKFKIILRSETEKRFWHGNVDLKITAQLVTLLRKNEVWSWYWYGISRSSCSNHRKYSERNIKLERDYELFRGGDPDILLAEAVDFFGKSWVWSAFILIILFYTSVFNVC